MQDQNGFLPTPFSGQGGGGFGNWMKQNGSSAAGGIGGIASGLYDIFGASNPYDAASQYYDKIPGMLQSTYAPYIQGGQQGINGLEAYMGRGNQAGSQLMDQYNQLTNNPGQMVNALGAAFHQSPGFGFQTRMALGAANRAAAAGGMAGSPEEQQNIADVTNQLANQDYYNYLNHSQQMYGAGLQGLQHTEGLGQQSASTLGQMGQQSANSLAENLGTAYMNQGNMAYGSNNFNNQMMGQGIGQIIGGAGDMAMLF